MSECRERFLRAIRVRCDELMGTELGRLRHRIKAFWADLGEAGEGPRLLAQHLIDQNLFEGASLRKARRLHLILLPREPERRCRELAEPLLSARPFALRHLARALRPHRKRIAEWLWEVFESPRKPAERLRAAAALAWFEKRNVAKGPAHRPPEASESFSPARADRIVKLLLSAPESEIEAWKEAFYAVRSSLRSPLREVLRNPRPFGKAITWRHRARAAKLLADYTDGNIEELIDFVLEAGLSTLPIFLRELRETTGDTSVALGRLSEAAHASTPPDGPPETFGEEPPLSISGNIASARLVLPGPDGEDWGVLSGPHRDHRTLMVHSLGEIGIPPTRVVDQLLAEASGADHRRALILALGSYPKRVLNELMSPQLRDFLCSEYDSDPDPGVHGAIAWLRSRSRALRRQWRSAERGGPPASRRSQSPAPGWLRDRVAGTMVVLPPTPGAGRVAIASSAVTKRRFQRFLDHEGLFIPDYGDRLPKKKQYKAGPAQGPAYGMSWYQAARYCDYLDRLGGLPPEESCYGFHDGEVVEVRPGHPQRRGFRLPSVPEWETACLAGCPCSRPFGDWYRFMLYYAWLQPARRKDELIDCPAPVRRLKPNDWGMFDMLGNVWEMTGDRFDRSSSTRFEPKGKMAIRGGDIYSQREYLKVDEHGRGSSEEPVGTLGFRVCRLIAGG